MKLTMYQGIDKIDGKPSFLCVAGNYIASSYYTGYDDLWCTGDGFALQVYTVIRQFETVIGPLFHQAPATLESRCDDPIMLYEMELPIDQYFGD